MTDSFIDSYSLYANAYSYMGRALTRDHTAADLFAVGIPFDLATSGRAGTRSGPMSIRQASANLRWEEKRWPWSFNVFDRLTAADYGDLEFDIGSNESLMAAVDEHIGGLLSADKTVLSFGGDHFVTLPLLRAHHARYGKMAMIHFDAHTDTYQEPGDIYNHGCMFHHAPREGLIDPSRSVQIGIRTEYTEADHAFNVINAAEANELAIEEISARIKDIVGDMPTYLTFDIDCLDPAYAPGTGTPVVGGITSDRALKLIRGISGINVVGMDVVEVAPSYDHAEITALAAATLGLEMLYMVASTRQGA
ncbi:MAG: agmatinase [Granulosicoccus sp.]|nr:agmatinase [Granulosicoccus sp.]